MKKKVWWKKAALLCGMMALLPFCMGICLVPTASPEPEVPRDQGRDAALVFTRCRSRIQVMRGPFPNRKFLSRIPSFQSVFGNCPIRKNKPRLSQWNKRTKKALRECTEGLFNCKL